MAGAALRAVRGRGRHGDRNDGTVKGTGEAPRSALRAMDEGDERMLELIEQLKAIQARPDAPEPSAG